MAPCAALLRLLCCGVMETKIVFITGTDTGVGKTLLTALLLCHLRAQGLQALALKPFCSGGRADAEILRQLQDGELTIDEINPFYFPEPVAPLVSARKRRQNIPLEHVVQRIQSIAERLTQIPRLPSGARRSMHRKLKTNNFLLIEGSGGLLVPLGEGYTVRDLIQRLACDVLVVSRNQLGTINHTLLTVQSLIHAIPHSALKLVLMDSSSPDFSRRSNPAILAELLDPVPLFQLPFLGPRCFSATGLKKNAKRFQKSLARLLL